jgi:hypothetical protein
MSSTCVVICRGASSARLTELTICYDTCLLVNEWSSELTKFEFISTFIKDQKKVIHVVNRDGRSLLRKEQYEEYAITHCQLNVRQPEYTQSPLKHRLDRIDVKTKFLSEELVPISKTGAGGFPSTGVLAVAHAAQVIKADTIHVIGLDFFEADYFSHHSHSKKPEAQDYQKKKGLVMKAFTTKLLAKFPDIEFVFFTNSSFDPSLNNVKIVR